MHDTIFALSSGSLPSGVAVIRVSGPRVSEVIHTLLAKPVQPRMAALRSIRACNGQEIDKGLVLYCPAPASFTGEDCLEFQVHGGRAVVNRLLHELGRFAATRPAEAGEFTRRAFENGKIDLIEAEGLSDLISAETEMQRRLAAEHAGGGLSALYASWANRITYARALIEAELDFADEDDVPGSVSDRIWADMEQLKTEIAHHLDTSKMGEIIRDGFKIAIIGPPNAGKSSLLNTLAKREIAIVTDVAGTTRDVISIDLDIGGYAVRLSDTAGIRDTDDLVEQEGVRRAHASASEADLVLLLQDPSQGMASRPVGPGTPVMTVNTKSDISAAALPADISISSKTGEGIDNLVRNVREHIKARLSVNSLAIPSRIRHVSYLKDALEFLSVAVTAKHASLDIRAEQLRLASRSLGKITGSVDVEALLDVIFSEFCVGK